MFSYISLEERVPAAHPLRKLRGVVDALLATMCISSETFGILPRPERRGLPRTWSKNQAIRKDRQEARFGGLFCWLKSTAADLSASPSTFPKIRKPVEKAVIGQLSAVAD
jgi:hypothetical protein